MQRATTAEQATRTALAGVQVERDRALKAEADTREQRDHAARLLSLSQAERGVRLLEQEDSSGLLYLVEARKTVDHLVEERMARTVLWGGWIESQPTSGWRAFPGSALVRAVAFSPDGRWVAAGGASKTVTIREVSSGRQVASVSAPQVGSAELSAEGRFLLVHAGSNKELWELDPSQAGRPPRRLMVVPMVWPAGGDIAMSPGGEWVFGGPRRKEKGEAPNAGPQFVLWNAKSGESRIIPFKPGNPQPDPVTGKWRSRERIVPPPTGRMGLSSDGTLLAAYLDGDLRLWDLPSGTIREKPLREAKPGRDGLSQKLLFSRDGRRLWEQLTSKAQLFDVAAAEPVTRDILYSGLPSPVMSRDGRWVGFAEANGLRILNVQTGERQGELLQSENNVRLDALAFSGDGSRLATGGRDGAIRLWEVATGRPLEQVHKHASRITALDFSDDGQWLAAATQDGSTHLHRTTRTARAPLWEGTNLAFLAFADGKLLVQSQTDGAVQPLDLRSGQLAGSPWPSSNGLPAVMGVGSVWPPAVVSPDGRTLASFSPTTNRQAQI